MIILIIFDKTCLKFSYTFIGETVLALWRPGFIINLNNMNNLEGESATDHLCQIISNLTSSFGQDFIFFFFWLLWQPASCLE